DSFSVVPLGGAQFQFDNMLSTMTKYMGDMFVIGFRIFLPVFACMMIMNCILGIMAKVAPQMNMFSVGIQLKIIAGFIVLFLIVYLIPNIANFIITEIKTMVVSIIDGMY
ncbi:MAG: flagellar biosynthetic protein FliR, partial [Agathobacter rectalis]